MTAYANTSSNVKVAQKIKKKPNIGLPKLEAWNYDACIHHDTPKANCEYRLCGNDFFAHQRVSIAWLYAIKKGLLASSPGTGKAQPVDCKVLTPSGWRRIGDLVPGDEVYEPNRRITKIKAIHPQGLQPYYNITMTDKSKTQATPDHLWKVRRGSDGPFFICTTEQLREEIKTRPMLQLPPTFVPGVGHVAREIFAIQKPNGGAWAECVCIELESEKQLYLTDDYIVTHNTNVILGLLCLLKQQNEIPRRSLIIVNTPSVKQWQAEAARFAPGLKVAAIPGGTKKSERIETYGGSWDVLIIGFHMMLKDMDLLRKINPSALLTDDVDPLLNDSTKVHQAITELSEDLDRVVVSNASSVGTDLIQLHSSMKPIGGKYIWGPKAAFEDNFIQKEWERIKVGTTVTTDAQGRRVSKPKYVSKSKVRGVKNASVLKETLDPWYIRYTYDDISDVAMPEVAPVTTVWLTMHKEQRKKYDELRAGVLKLTKDGHEEIKDVQALQMFAQPLNAKVLTPEGWSTIGNIKIGDSVSTPGGGSAKVTGKSVVREAEVFRVTLMDGSTTLASGDHLWEVNNKTQSKGKGRYTCTRVLSTNDLLEDYIQQYPSDVKNNVVRYKYSLPKADSVNLEDVDLPVDPYVMGALLGDGRLGKHGSVTITSSDDFILDTLCASFDPGFLKYTKTLKKNGVFSRKPCWDIIFSKNVILPDRCLSCLSENYVHYSRGLCRLCYDKHTRAGTREQFPKVITNPLIEKISTLGLKGATASEKFVPEVYKNAGFNQRLEILRGLMDTDGSLHSRNNATFSSVSRQLRDDVADLARSLGGYCCKYEYPADNTSGVVYLAHVVTPMNPFKIKRKADRWSPHTAETQKIVKIESVGHMEVQCIMVDSERHLYITDDYMVTHNTYGQMLTAGLPVLGEEDGPGKSVKFDWFCSQVQQEWSDEKVICFVRNKKAIAALKARLDKMGIGCAEVTGNKVGDERQAEITRFWEDENCRVIFCSAAGVRSLNLQCARIVCFLDIPSLNPESVHQAVGRARRAGGHDRVYPFFVMCEDTQEDKYEEVLQQRETISRWVWESEDHLLPKMSAREILRLILP